MKETLITVEHALAEMRAARRARIVQAVVGGVLGSVGAIILGRLYPSWPMWADIAAGVTVGVGAVQLYLMVREFVGWS